MPEDGGEIRKPAAVKNYHFYGKYAQIMTLLLGRNQQNGVFLKKNF
ncbi:MAG: hypothetical protein LUH00_07355 [Lachnospiraceae bacterium]|nr:hypothetical protein [Lachnospiraceae bacterium]